MTTVDVGRRLQEAENALHGGDRNASPQERVRALPESRARAISPPIGGDSRANRDRIERVIPAPVAPREGVRTQRDEGVQRERPGAGAAIERRTAPSEPAIRQQERAPRAELRQGPIGQAPAQGAADRRIDRQQPDRDKKAPARADTARGK